MTRWVMSGYRSGKTIRNAMWAAYDLSLGRDVLFAGPSEAVERATALQALRLLRAWGLPKRGRIRLSKSVGGAA